MSSITERISRRTLLTGSGTVLFSLSLPGAALGRKKRRPSHLRRSSYEPLVGRFFRVGCAPHRLRLVAVENLNPQQAGSENAFALVFRASPGAPRLAHQVPWLYHFKLGPFRLLLSPGKPSAAGQPYVAVINRLHG